MKFSNSVKPMVAKIAMLIVLGLSVANFAHAQTPAVFSNGVFDDPSGPVETSTDGGPTVPFDGGMSLILLAAGVGYAVKQQFRIICEAV